MNQTGVYGTGCLRQALRKADSSSVGLTAVIISQAAGRGRRRHFAAENAIDDTPQQIRWPAAGSRASIVLSPAARRWRWPR